MVTGSEGDIWGSGELPGGLCTVISQVAAFLCVRTHGIMHMGAESSPQS